MTKNNMWVAGWAMPVVIAMLLLSAATPNVTANTQPAAPATAEVKIDNFSFGPGTLTVPVVSTEGVFKSKVLDTDEKYSFTFSKAGTFPYFCSIHPKMTGKVVVQ
jgi:plastocyanin